MTDSLYDKNPPIEPLKNYTKISGDRKQGIESAKQYMNMIAETLLYYSKKEESLLFSKIPLEEVSGIFKKFVDDIDNGVTDKQAVKSFTNNIGITSSNARPKFNAQIVYQEVEIELVNSFSWIELGGEGGEVKVRKMMRNNAELKDLTSEQKKLLPVNASFHKKNSLSKAIEIVSKKYSISPHTLKASYLDSRNTMLELTFDISKQIEEDNMREKGFNEGEIFRESEKLNFENWKLEQAKKRGLGLTMSGFNACPIID